MFRWGCTATVNLLQLTPRLSYALHAFHSLRALHAFRALRALHALQQ